MMDQAVISMSEISVRRLFIVDRAQQAAKHAMEAREDAIVSRALEEVAAEAMTYSCHDAFLAAQERGEISSLVEWDSPNFPKFLQSPLEAAA